MEFYDDFEDFMQSNDINIEVFKHMNMVNEARRILRQEDTFIGKYTHLHY